MWPFNWISALWNERTISILADENLLKFCGFGEGDLYGVMSAESIGERLNLVTMHLLYEQKTGKIVEFLKRGVEPTWYQQNTFGVARIKLLRDADDPEEFQAYELSGADSGIAGLVIQRTIKEYNTGKRVFATSWLDVYKGKEVKRKELS